MSISTADIKTLREATGAGILDCRKALEETGGDQKKALSILRERGLEKAAKRADREANNGMLDLYSHGGGRVGVMVEVNCETDFVARTAEFKKFAHEIGLQIAAASATWVNVEDIPEDIIAEKREAVRKHTLEEGKPEKIVDKIIEGRMAKYFDETCLLRQPYIRDDSKTVEDVLKEMILSTGEKIVIRRFERWTVGEK